MRLLPRRRRPPAAPPPDPRCIAITRAQRQCALPAAPGDTRCLVHRDKPDPATG